MPKVKKIDLKNLSLEEMEKLAVEYGRKPYSGRQLFKWIFREGLDDFSLMTDLAKTFRADLERHFVISKLEEVDRLSSIDGTSKTLWQTGDGLYIESVVIPDEKRLTLCLSSQAGCPLNCSFCATGKMGFKRNLTPGEMFDQYRLTTLGLAGNSNLTNIVFMGMGEPLLNYDNLLKVTDLLTGQLGAGMAARKITVSTVGLVRGIYRLADQRPGLNLAISLHSAIEAKRRKLIPVASKYPLEEIKKAAIYFADKSDNRVTFEYLLIRDINDSLADAGALADFVRGIPCKINLIVYNPIDGIDYGRPDDSTVAAFRDHLLPRTPAVTMRKSRGLDIAAACGQLAGKKQNPEADRGRRQ